ncbi:SCO family protein [Priestia filamentosa]|uniref:SCO family protein n=1 Tax=Priestia filamentosa TaxID=1402861 RepID=UPI001FB32954|nr:SCO family protein [Priestia filamentosa]UOE59497.1 SCO family protein [Priestia filamentosa]
MKRKSFLWLVCSLFLLTACGEKKEESKAETKEEQQLSGPIADFTYENQSGEPFSSQSLDGKVWIANFIFTSCTTVCPPMTSHMSKLQEKAKEEGADVEFVSFTVDPTVDSSEKLKEFSEEFEANSDNWQFLTGYSQEEIETFARENFYMNVQKPSSGDQVIHGTTFFLLNQKGQIVKDYDGVSNVPYEDIIHEAKELEKSS